MRPAILKRGLFGGVSRVPAATWRSAVGGLSKSVRFLLRAWRSTDDAINTMPVFAKNVKSSSTQYTTMASLRCMPLRWPLRGGNPTQHCRTSPPGKIASHGTAAGPDGGSSCCPVPGVTFQPRQQEAPTADRADTVSCDKAGGNRVQIIARLTDGWVIRESLRDPHSVHH